MFSLNPLFNCFEQKQAILTEIGVLSALAKSVGAVSKFFQAVLHSGSSLKVFFQLF